MRRHMRGWRLPTTCWVCMRCCRRIKSFPKAKEFAESGARNWTTHLLKPIRHEACAIFWELNWSAAGRDFQRAIALDPSFALAHHWYGEYWIYVGKAERAVAEMKRARELDPLSLAINGTSGGSTVMRASMKKRSISVDRRWSLDPHFAMGHWCLGQVYVGKRLYAAADC